MIKTNAQQAGGTLTLQQSIETGIANNLTVKQSELAMQRAGVGYRQAKGNMIPTLNANVIHGINQGRTINPFTNTYINQQLNIANYGLGTDVTLFNGFRLLNALKQNSLAYDASRMELEQAKYELTIDIVLAYLQVLSNEDQLALSKKQVALSMEQVERLETLHKQGAIPPAQLYDLKGQLASDELSIVNNQNALDASKLALAQLMNVPYDKNLQLERLNADQFSMTYAGDPESIFQTAMRELALVKAAELRKQSADRGVKAARGGLTPNFFFTAEINTNYSSAGVREIILNQFNDTTSSFVSIGSNNFKVITPSVNTTTEKIRYVEQLKNNYGTFVGIGINIPILNSFRARNQVSLAKIDRKNAEYTLQATHIQLKQAIEQAYFNMKAAEQRYRVLQQQVDAFTLSFHAAEVRFNAGVGTSIDYLIAKDNVDRANINLVSARYDYVLRTKILDYYQNKPLW
ncbi:MAG TPA: TolC family protein [Chitinophagaceae bacterium]|nr:TolC family protein [Chitinophagaceae bacterium]